jgi:hypothetical protein
MTGGDVLGATLESLFFLVLLYILYLPFRGRTQPNSTGGVLEGQAGRNNYGYVLGNDLYAYPAYGNFHGLDISLPIEMPHIYLDSLRSGGHGVGAVFDSNQRISLEGDFDKYFAVFVPQKYESIALSILSPDVMATLEDKAWDFDVEIYGSHLRIISNKKPLKDIELQQRMLAVAQEILPEIEGRMRSWTEANTREAYTQDLFVYPSKGVRIFGRYMSWARFWLSVFWCMCVLGFLMAGVSLFAEGHVAQALGAMVVTVIVFAALELFTTRSEQLVKFWARRS